MKTTKLTLLALMIPIAASAQLAVPTGLTGSINNGNLILRWEAPETEDPTPTVEGFENYNAYITDGIGEWTMIDVDGAETDGWYDTKDGDYLSAGYYGVYSWIVMSNENLSKDRFTNCEGSHILASFMTWGVSADNWAVSPALNGQAQTITLKAMALNSYYGGNAEPLGLYASSKGKSIEDFTEVKTVTVENNSWSDISFNVPEGTKYFALRYQSDYGSGTSFGMGVDAISYLPEGAIALDLNGFNVYCDGKKINDDIVVATQYTIENGATESHDYSVTAVYAQGESDLSEIYSHIGGSGIENVKVSETSEDVFNLQGIRVGNASTINSLPSGIYIVSGKKIHVK